MEDGDLLEVFFEQTGGRPIAINGLRIFRRLAGVEYRCQNFN